MRSCITTTVFGVLTTLSLVPASTLSADRGLIGHWAFDAIEDDKAEDSSGGDRHAKVHGATRTEGRIGGALTFDGQDDYVELGDLGEHKAVTIAFWMKTGDVDRSGGWQGLVTSDGWEEGVFHIPLKRGIVDVHLHMGDARRGRLSSSRLANDVWYHVAIVTDTTAGTLELFTNGVHEDMGDLLQFSTSIILAKQVVGREFDGSGHSRYFRGSIDDVRIYGRALTAVEIRALCPDAPPPPRRDPRNIRSGHRIPDEGYCDQPYTVVTKDGNWLCTMTTGPGREGDHGQHIVATISEDKGRTWSPLIDIEPSDGPEASWVIPLITPNGRVYGFYTYNGEHLRTWKDKPIRTDTVGWYCYKYSDDGGRTWSKERYRLPLPPAPVDQTNTFGGAHQIFWGIGKPIVHDGTMWFAFSRCGALVVDKSEGWFFRSDNILAESDPDRIQWQLLPDGEHGLKDLEYGDVHAEQNIVALSDGSLYCMYRTKIGYPFHAYSRDGGHTWTDPVHATYTPDGRKMKTPRACPRIWRTKNGKYLFWYHNHSDTSNNGFSGRNPAWVSGGVERDGYIHWSQPEILLYDPNPAMRMSYPDLIEQDGRYWVTETQKTVARVHEIDKSVLEALWTQGVVREVVRDGLVVELDDRAIQTGTARLPKPLDVEESGGIALDLWFQFDDLAGDRVIVDSRTTGGVGLALVVTDSNTIRIELNDGRTKASWECDPDVLSAGKLHHVAAIVDAGPGIISFVIDGVLANGGETRPFGWHRYSGMVGDVSGSGELRFAQSLRNGLKKVRIYNRYLRTSEAVANFHAGP